MAPDLLGTSSLFYSEAAGAADLISQTSTAQPVTKPAQTKTPPTNEETHYKWEMAWVNIIGFIYLHYAAVCGVHELLTTATWLTWFWVYITSILVSQGITAGAHRLWAHKAYKAKLPLRIFLAYCQTMAFQNHIYEWVRDHRVHHKFTDTDADPHNAQRGFFFSHMGWLMIKKHKDVKGKGKAVDMSDLEADPIVRFQRKYYLALMPICCFVIPSLVPWYFWNENLMISWHVCLFRYCFNLHATWLVNSAAHMFGSRPYDRCIGPAENRFVSLWTCGEGFHNYHHVFPWDYKAAELGFSVLNLTTCFINIMARIGWAYDLKTVSQDMIRKRVARTGDASLIPASSVDHHHHNNNEEIIWGWGDKDMKQEDREEAEVYNQLKED